MRKHLGSDPPVSDPAAAYDEWYREPGAAHWEAAPGKRVLVQAIQRCCDVGARLRLLDVGCGTGSFLESLRLEVAARWEYHGVDVSSVAIERGRARHPDLMLAVGDGSRLDQAQGTFDAVVCYGSWEHFPDPELAISEAARVLSPGGWVFAMIPALGIHRSDRADEGWYEDTEVAASSVRQMQWNLRRETWAAMFERAGLLLLDGALAARCGAEKPGVFFFAVRGPSPSSRRPIGALLELGRLAARLAVGAAEDLRRGVDLIASALERGGKVLVCGNGGSAADAQHFVAEMVGRLRRPRRALAAIALSADTSVLTALGNDYGYEAVFERQVEALGAPGDLLLAITTSGRSANVLRAVAQAKVRGMVTVALVGEEGASVLSGCDLCLAIPSRDTQRIQEAQIAVLHLLAEGVEARIADRGPSSPAEGGARGGGR